ncbi:MAG: polyprenyl synthetase family protein [Gammaproteobacteria bacterium]
MTGLAEELSRYDKDLRRIARTAGRLARSDVPLASAICRRQMAGGKRLRAVVALLCGRLCGLPDALNDKIAIGVEIIHTATLLHDDVVDDAPMRRRQSTANRMHGNAAAVLAGDFLYSRASQIFADIGSLPLLSRIAQATNGLAEGEILQLQQSGKWTGEAAYFEIIGRKTANLFELAAEAPALARGDSRASALAGYGRHLGTAFQLVDDCLDYSGDAAETGKKIGADFGEGKMTLPAILALAKSGAAARRRMLAGWRQNDAAAFADTLRLVQETGALAETRRRAAEYARRAEESLRPAFGAKSRAALAALVRASANRSG